MKLCPLLYIYQKNAWENLNDNSTTSPTVPICNPPAHELSYNVFWLSLNPGTCGTCKMKSILKFPALQAPNTLYSFPLCENTQTLNFKTLSKVLDSPRIIFSLYLYLTSERH